MKTGNIEPRAVIEPTSLALWASVLTILPPRIPDVTSLSVPTWLCGSLPQRSVLSITLISLELKVFQKMVYVKL